jgi:hypothetical protein
VYSWSIKLYTMCKDNSLIHFVPLGDGLMKNKNLCPSRLDIMLNFWYLIWGQNTKNKKSPISAFLLWRRAWFCVNYSLQRFYYICYKEKNNSIFCTTRQCILLIHQNDASIHETLYRRRTDCGAWAYVAPSLATVHQQTQFSDFSIFSPIHTF